MARISLMLAVVLSQAPLGPNDGFDLPPTDLDRIQVGQPAFDFTLLDVDGNRVTLSEQRGKKVVLVFSRGHW